MKIPTENPDADNSDFRKLSEYLSWGAYAAFALMLLSVMLQLIEGAPYIPVDGSVLDRTVGTWSKLLLAITMLSPLIIMAGVAQDVGRLFWRYAQGDAFSKRAAKTIANIGKGLGLVVIFKGVVVPTIIDWTSGVAGFSIDIDDYDFGIAFAGAAVMAIGYVMHQAVAIKAESDQII